MSATNQIGRVREVLASGGWFTLPEIASFTRDPEASISARIRDLRKPQFGGHRVERRRLNNGLYAYQMNGF